MNFRPVSGSGRQAATGGAALPCLYSNNCIGKESKQLPAFYEFFKKDSKADELNTFSTSNKKSATALEMNVASFIEAKGVNNVGFLTLTFPDHVIDVREASRRFHSLQTNFLSKSFGEYIGVFERHKSKRIHFHFLIDVKGDIRSGLDFKAVDRRDYRTANKKLRSVWALLRKRLPAYGFGRSELLPVKSNSAGLSKYISKYICKAIEARLPEDKGFRLVRMSKDKGDGWKVANTRFAYLSAGSKKWREALKEWATTGMAYMVELAARRRIFVESITQDNYSTVFKAVLGDKWAYKNRKGILQFSDYYDTQRLAA